MNAKSLKEVIDRASYVINLGCHLNGDETRKGGFLCVADTVGQSQMILLVGQVSDPAKAERYKTFCQEKAIRLSRHPEHLSSWQSRNQAGDRYGGAIRAGDSILSFSGLPELWDEACMIVLASQLGLLKTDGAVQSVMDINNSLHARELFDAMRGP